MGGRILLVDANVTTLRAVEHVLSAAGYSVASATGFDSAKSLVRTMDVDLLVTAIRLDAFNGLHLVARCRFDRPKLPVIVTDIAADPVLEQDALRLNASYVVDPVGHAEDFLRLVHGATGEADAQPRRSRPIN